jgi:hypothetical protein
MQQVLHEKAELTFVCDIRFSGFTVRQNLTTINDFVCAAWPYALLILMITQLGDGAYKTRIARISRTCGSHL